MEFLAIGGPFVVGLVTTGKKFLLLFSKRRLRSFLKKRTKKLLPVWLPAWTPGMRLGFSVKEIPSASPLLLNTAILPAAGVPASLATILRSAR